MVRVAARYGLEVPEMSIWLARQGSGIPAHRLIDDIAPDRNLLRLWARACRVDTIRLVRLTLASRFLYRVPTWILERSEMPVCLGCFEADQAIGRDSYMRSAWRLGDLFGAKLDFDVEMPDTVRRLFSRAVPVLPRRQCLCRRSDEEKRSVDWATGRVQRLSKSPVHRLSESFLDERCDFGRIHP